MAIVLLFLAYFAAIGLIVNFMGMVGLLPGQFDFKLIGSLLGLFLLCCGASFALMKCLKKESGGIRPDAHIRWWAR
ncbi:hypothetical protein ACKTEK_04530 [Tepidamorphus sp. 3E244]|uniref:hypothetical protein n=1 Tax=Tepidamorphus sp. 3E244 TaxID=3385498 RepID=UPI0038FC92EC